MKEQHTRNYNTIKRFIILLPVLMLGITAIQQSAFASCFTWINTTGGQWSRGGNWSGGVVPPPGADICINLPGTYRVEVDASIIVGSLTLGRPDDGVQSLAVLVSLSIGDASKIDSTGVLLLHNGTLNAGPELTNFGELRIDQWSSSLKTLRGQIINRRTMSINSRVRMLGGGHLILNEEDGTLTLEGDTEINQQNGASTITNRGNMFKADDGDTTSIRVLFRNEGGTVHAGAGQLLFTNVNLAGGSYYSGPDGEIIFDFTSAFNYMSGRLSGNPEGAIVFESGNLRADETEAILDFGGEGLIWNGGTFMSQGNGTWINEGLIRTSGSSNKTLSGVTFTNRGLIELGAQVNLGSAATLINEQGAQLGITGSATIGTSTGSGTFINRGLFYKELSENTATITPAFNNEGGDVDVRTGTLRFRNVRLIGGTYNADADAVLALDFASEGYAQGRLSGNPDGTIVFQSGNLNAFEGTAILDFGNEGFHYTGGNFRGDPTSGLDSGDWLNEGLVRVYGESSKGMNVSTFINRGTMLFDANVNFLGGPSAGRTLTNMNEGIIRLGDGVVLSFSQGQSWLVNHGLLTRSGEEDGTSTISLVFDNESDGLITGKGTWTFNNLRRNDGRIATGESPGLLNWTGMLRMDATTAGIDIEIGGDEPGISYDRLNISGSLPLRGELAVSMIDGFTPQDGDMFVPVTADGITGAFEVLNGLTSNNISLYPTIADTAVILTARMGIPTVSGTPEVNPSALTNGNITTFNISGTGFAPDAVFRLECTSCDFPELSFPVNGRIRNMTATDAQVQFDLRDAFISGVYNLVIEDPRGGLSTAPITINGNPGLTGVSVYAKRSDASERGPQPGVITLRFSTPTSSRVAVNYELDGTADPFVHYVTSVPYVPANPTNFFFVPAGVSEFDVVITPLPNFDHHNGKTVVFRLLGSDNYEIGGQTHAEITIENGPAPTEMDIFAASPNVAGNSGTILMLIAGQGLTEGATARLTGNSNIDADFVFVDPNGSMLHALFDVTDLAPGSVFSLSVTDGSGKTATIQNTLLIEELVEPEISVDLTGPSFFRSWLPPQRHFVTVTNRGNVDVMMVPLSISVTKGSGGLIEPEFEIIDIDPTGIEGAAEGFTGWEGLNSIEDWGDRYVLSVMIPVVKAGETKVFPFLGRGRNYKAWTAPTSAPVVRNTGPVYTSVATAPRRSVLDTPGKPINVWMGVTSGEFTEYALMQSNSSDAQIANCFLTAGAAILGSLPILGCGSSVALFFTNLVASGVSVALNNSTSNSVISTGSIMGSMLSATLACAKAATPWGIAVGAIVGTVSVIDACFDPFGEPDGDGLNASEIGAYDPNDKLGPSGNTDMRYTAGIDAAGYLIRFENDTSATAPALLVHITDQIDTEKFDLSTFNLGPIGFGDILVTPPQGLKQWSTTVEIPGESRFVVKILASLDEETGVANWQMMAIDPETGQYPADATAGFLPPNNNPPEGDGSVFFTIKPKADLPSGTQLCNEARIIFDVEEPIDTPPWCNTLDYDRPTSSMDALAEVQSDTSFTLSWAGFDQTSGIQDYLIYVSTNDGPFRLWKSSAEESGEFVGKPDSSYSFYSVARDLAGNIEQKTPAVEVRTTINLATSIDETGLDIPKVFAMHQNYPNPFNPATSIRYDVPEASHVTIELFNVLGQKIVTLVNGEHQPGYHVVVWNSTGSSGAMVASGVYIYRIRAGRFVQERKLMLIK